MNELKALQITATSSYFVQLTDYFEDEKNIYMVRKYFSKTLKSVVAKMADPLLPEPLVQNFIAQTAKALSKLHQRNIVHRDLRMEALKIRSKKKLVLQLGSFDFAYCLKKN